MKNVQMKKIKDIFLNYGVILIVYFVVRKFPNEGTFGSSVYLFYFGHKPKPCGGYFRRIVTGTCGLYVRRSFLLRQLFHAFKRKLSSSYAYFLYRPVHWCYFSRILRLFNRYSGFKTERRLFGYRNLGLRRNYQKHY